MSNVIDMNKYKSVKDVDTDGAYMQITIGESADEDVIILVEQVEVEVPPPIKENWYLT